MNGAGRTPGALTFGACASAWRGSRSWASRWRCACGGHGAAAHAQRPLRLLGFGAFCAFGYRGPDRVTAGVASVVEAVVWLATLLLALFGMAWTTVARSAWWCRVLVLLVVRR